MILIALKEEDMSQRRIGANIFARKGIVLIGIPRFARDLKTYQPLV